MKCSINCIFDVSLISEYWNKILHLDNWTIWLMQYFLSLIFFPCCDVLGIHLSSKDQTP